jgi:hypothetical protein
MSQTSNILYTLQVAKGSGILAFENSTGRNDKRQRELHTKDGRERRDGTSRVIAMVPLPTTL